MNPDIFIFHTYSWPDSLSMIPDGMNNLTHQSVGTNDAPGTHSLVPLHGILSRNGLIYATYT